MDHLEAERLVNGFYRGFLRREPDVEGLQHYTNQLVSGVLVSTVADAFLSSSEFKSYSKTKLFVPPGHFYSPIVDEVEAERHLATLHGKQAPLTIDGINLVPQTVIECWGSLLPFLKSMPFSPQAKSGLRYHFDNDAYAMGDGSILHAMIRLKRPIRIIEIGSGWSSACTLDTVSQYLGGKCELTFIDPYPALLRSLISTKDQESIRIIDKPIQAVDPEIFSALEANDILFIDSTHVVRTGSDVCFELFEILPKIRPGVIVHIHDMFWPFEYPRLWVIDQNRSWNELYAIRAFLQGNSEWSILMFNDYIAKCHSPLVQGTFPQFMGNVGSAMWMTRT